MDEDTRLKLQFEYAWKWFEYHAGQRISMFNFFLVTIGVFVAAYGTGLRADHKIAVLIGYIGFGLCLIFILLDTRNRHLIEFAEKVLLENEAAIFEKQTKPDKKSTPTGISDQGLRLQDKSKTKCWRAFVQHMWWIPIIEGSLALCFLYGAYYAAHVL